VQWQVASVVNTRTAWISVLQVVMAKTALTCKRANLIDTSTMATTRNTVTVIDVSTNFLAADDTLLKSVLAIAAVILQTINTHSTRSTSVANAIVNILTVQ